MLLQRFPHLDPCNVGFHDDYFTFLDYLGPPSCNANPSQRSYIRSASRSEYQVRRADKQHGRLQDRTGTCTDHRGTGGPKC